MTYDIQRRLSGWYFYRATRRPRYASRNSGWGEAMSVCHKWCVLNC